MQCCGKKDKCNHINIAELDAVLKGINLKWELKKEIWTDLATILS